MAKRPISFPHFDPAAEPEAIVKHRGEIVIRLGRKRYAIDITKPRARVALTSTWRL